MSFLGTGANGQIVYNENTHSVLIMQNGIEKELLKKDGSAGSPTISSISGEQAIGETDSIVLLTATSTVSLPDATLMSGKTFRIKRLNAEGDSTITGINGQTIDGGNSAVLGQQYKILSIISDGSNWLTI